MSDLVTTMPLTCIKCHTAIRMPDSYIIYDEGPVHVGCSQIKPPPDELSRLRAENERLTELCSAYKGQVEAGAACIAGLEGEIAELKENLALTERADDLEIATGRERAEAAEKRAVLAALSQDITLSPGPRLKP